MILIYQELIDFYIIINNSQLNLLNDIHADQDNNTYTPQLNAVKAICNQYLDNDQTNRNIDNLRLLCFNCYFLLKKDTEPNMKNLPLTKSSLKIHKAFGVEPPSLPEAVSPTPPAAPIDPGSIGISDIEQWIAEDSS